MGLYKTIENFNSYLKGDVRPYPKSYADPTAKLTFELLTCDITNTASRIKLCQEISPHIYPIPTCFTRLLPLINPIISPAFHHPLQPPHPLYPPLSTCYSTAVKGRRELSFGQRILRFDLIDETYDGKYSCKTWVIRDGTKVEQKNADFTLTVATRPSFKNVPIFQVGRIGKWRLYGLEIQISSLGDRFGSWADFITWQKATTHSTS